MKLIVAIGQRYSRYLAMRKKAFQAYKTEEPDRIKLVTVASCWACGICLCLVDRARVY